MQIKQAIVSKDVILPNSSSQLTQVHSVPTLDPMICLQCLEGVPDPSPHEGELRELEEPREGARRRTYQMELDDQAGGAMTQL